MKKTITNTGMLVVLCLLSFSSMSKIYVTSVEAKVETRPTYNPGEVDYKFTWQWIPQPGDNEKVPAGMNQFLVAPVEPGGRINIGAPHGLFTNVETEPTPTISPADGSKTWAEVESSWRKGRTSGTFAVGRMAELNAPYVVSCLGAIARKSAAVTSLSEATSNGGFQCMNAPPVEGALCNVSSNITLDFGSVTSGNETGRTTTASTSLTCNIDATVELDDVRGLSGDVSFEWGIVHTTLNGQKLPLRIDVVKNIPASLLFSGVIEATSDAPAGDYTGFYPLVIEFQ